MTELEKDKMIEQQNQAITVLNNRLEMAEADKRTLEQDNTRLQLLLDTVQSDNSKLRFIISNMKGKSE
jgi:hypothetical protein